MTENPTVLYLQRLERLVDALRADVIELKRHFGALELQYAALSQRLDRINGRLDLSGATTGTSLQPKTPR